MKTLSPIISPVLIAFLVLSSWPLGVAVASTALVSTEEALEAEQANAARERISEVLTRDDLQRKLVAHGVDMAEVEARVAALSAEEAHQLADQLEQLPAGAGIGAVVGVLFVIFAILLVTDILGLTDVYPFTR